MARKFAGSPDRATVAGSALSIGLYSVLSVSFWAWIDDFATTQQMILTFDKNPSPDNQSYFQIAASGASANHPQIGFADSAAAKYWIDTFPHPTAAAWHHWLVVMDRATPSNKVWIDSVAQVMTSDFADAATYGLYRNNGAYQIMGRVSTDWYCAGRLAELAVWGGQAWGLNEAKALYGGCSPFQIGGSESSGVSNVPEIYIPFLDAADDEHTGRGTTTRSLTLTGSSTSVQHPAMGIPVLGRV